ncbi:hypothetical protein E4198_08350 [Streptomyces sp. RKND-216]|uniref:hypothetical protein n=1 Tax=Streptomyces sp. RKND-216 TaxID=2562581 RepID=UPI00109D84F0|nr:hypothetical protein [Streptomyces sp. RKND-216]THA24748.1 hypothetical protein E4198_08350 [Streptomyces sp. RKND-216]
MSIRPARARRASTVVAVTVGTALALAGCSDGGSPPSEPSSSQTAPQEGGKEGDTAGQEQQNQTLAEVKSGDITLRISSALREQGGFVTVRGTVTNAGSDRWAAPGWQGDEVELADNQASMAGAKLVDKEGRKRYFILRDTEGRCLCTKFNMGLGGGDSTDWYAQFPAPPEGNDEVDFQIADMPPATVSLSEG